MTSRSLARISASALAARSVPGTSIARAAPSTSGALSVAQSAFSSRRTFASLRTTPISLRLRAATPRSSIGALFQRYASTTNAAAPTARPSSQSQSQSQKQSPDPDPGSEADPDEPPKRASIRERLRFLTRRYGWWALGVYLLASAFDFTAVFLAIHFLGAEHIRELEDAARKAVGLGKRDLVEGEEPALPSSADGENNADAAAQAAKVLKESTQAAPPAASKSSKSGGQSALWAEAVLAYTIHKTLLLPFRVGITAAVTPSFVKWLIRMGWAKPNTAVKRAAEKAAAAKASAKAAN